MRDEIFVIDGDDRARLRALMAIAYTLAPSLAQDVPILDVERKHLMPVEPSPVGLNRHERRAMKRKGRK